jgi:hypothetical protein
MSNPIAENRQQHEREIARIRDNPDLSAGAKNRKIQEVHERASAEHRRLVAEASSASRAAVREAERRVLGIPYPGNARPHERAIIAMSYRDALERAERAASDTGNPDALAGLLGGAESAGDELQAVAAYHVATVGGRRDVADAYLGERPAARAHWEGYVEARGADAGSAPVRALIGTAAEQVPPARPPELSPGRAAS